MTYALDLDASSAERKHRRGKLGSSTQAETAQKPSRTGGTALAGAQTAEQRQRRSSRVSEKE